MEKSMPQPKGMPEIASPLLVEASILLELPVVLGSRSDITLRLTRKFLGGFPVAVRFL